MSTIASGTAQSSPANGNGKPPAVLPFETNPAEIETADRCLSFERYFTQPDVHPFDAVEWEVRDAVLRNEKGATVFEQRDVEVPAFWSPTATNVVASKYFRGALDSPERENSARQLISRVADTISAWGESDGLFRTHQDAAAFNAELTHLLLHQRASFNSPVWFNVGLTERPQCSACFINSVADDMGSILDLARTEAMLFKYGSGAGSNLSTLRSSREALSGGGTASGPVSFMKGLDAFAGVIKSGGKTRRAAKMVILNADHPDIHHFVRSKEDEERKAWALVEAGYEAGFTVAGGAYDSVAYQNANHSVRVTDKFMQAVIDGGEWTTRAVTDGRAMDTFPARELMRAIADATSVCGDPGMQFDTTINAWHTCPRSGRIEASNPCSEYMFLNDSACNLASLNLLRFDDPENGFDIDGFRHACEVVITAQEILVDHASYPTPKIEENSHRFRPLGLGYANLGALLMARGLPYDSDAGRDFAAVVTALLTGSAYAQSARIAAALGPFESFAENRESLLGVLRKHRDALGNVSADLVPDTIRTAARASWDEAVILAESRGVRNSQISVLAPTGTIAFMMDCDTTGIEPDLALVKYKQLVGGGSMKIVNNTVPVGLKRLGYDDEAIGRLVEHLHEHGTLEDAEDLTKDHLPVFDCAFKAPRGQRSIHYMGHLKMLAAVQPFLSGAISKTVNMPNEVTVDEIMMAYTEAWKMGVKAVAIYRDGCKRSQPLMTKRSDSAGDDEKLRRARRRLPDERQAVTHKFSVQDHEGYITVGLYPDGKPGEIFVVMAKEGSTISGLVDAFATAISIALQYGVPLKTLVDKFSHMRFEPSGWTKKPEIPYAKSIIDYIFRWLALKFLDPDEQQAVGLVQRGESEETPSSEAPREATEALSVMTSFYQQDAPSCHVCGLIMVRNGSCYKCLNCGTSSGCS